MVAQLRSKIAALGGLGHDLLNKDFLLTWERDERALRAILLTAETLEELTRLGMSARTFDSGLGVAVFRDKSTRTRYSFRAACNLLGLATEELDESTSQIAHGETVRETAAMVVRVERSAGSSANSRTVHADTANVKAKSRQSTVGVANSPTAP